MDVFSYLLGKKSAGGGSGVKIYESEYNSSTKKFSNIAANLGANDFVNGFLKIILPYEQGGQTTNIICLYHFCEIEEGENMNMIFLHIIDGEKASIKTLLYTPSTGALAWAGS